MQIYLRPPAGHRRAVEGQMRLKLGAAAERLNIQGLESDYVGLLSAEALHVLYKCSPAIRRGGKPQRPLSILMVGSDHIIEPAAVNQARELD